MASPMVHSRRAKPSDCSIGKNSIRNQAIFLKSTGGHLGFGERVYLGTRLAVARGAIFFHKHN